jgi:hypothetical protein
VFHLRAEAKTKESPMTPLFVTPGFLASALFGLLFGVVAVVTFSWLMCHSCPRCQSQRFLRNDLGRIHQMQCAACGHTWNPDPRQPLPEPIPSTEERFRHSALLLVRRNVTPM